MVVTCRRNGERGAAPVPACPLRLRKGRRPCPCAPPAAAQGWPTAPFGLAQGWQSRPCAGCAGWLAGYRGGWRLLQRASATGAYGRMVKFSRCNKPTSFTLLIYFHSSQPIPAPLVYYSLNSTEKEP